MERLEMEDYPGFCQDAVRGNENGIYYLDVIIPESRTTGDGHSHIGGSVLLVIEGRSVYGDQFYAQDRVFYGRSPMLISSSVVKIYVPYGDGNSASADYLMWR
jgi:hypothetical protein